MTSKLTWMGHAAFVVHVNNFVVLLDPWLRNPKAPEKAYSSLTRVDAILLSHGHFDHIGDTVELAAAFDCKVYCIHEVSIYLKGQGVAAEKIVSLNKGGVLDIGGGCKASMVNAIHSGDCGMEHPMAPGGAAAGWILQLPNGHCIYHTGDTDVFGDMQIISDLYNPDVALMCIGGHFTMGPRGAAYALDKLLPTVQIAVPMHYGTFGLLAGTPGELQQALSRKDVNVCRLQAGESLPLPGRSIAPILSTL